MSRKIVGIFNFESIFDDINDQFQRVVLGTEFLSVQEKKARKNTRLSFDDKKMKNIRKLSKK